MRTRGYSQLTELELTNANHLPSAKFHPIDNASHEDELQVERLKNKILELRGKILHLEKSKLVNSFFVSTPQKNSCGMNASEIVGKENLDSQWRQCIVEHRETYMKGIALYPDCLGQKVVDVESMEKVANLTEAAKCRKSLLRK